MDYHYQSDMDNGNGHWTWSGREFISNMTLQAKRNEYMRKLASADAPIAA